MATYDNLIVLNVYTCGRWKTNTKKVQDEQEDLFVSKTRKQKEKYIKGSRATSSIQNLLMM